MHSYPSSPLQLCDTSISVVSPGIAWSLLWRTECWSHSLWPVAPVLPKHIHFLVCGCSLHVLLFCGMLIQTQSESFPVPGAPPLQGMHTVWWGWVENMENTNKSLPSHRFLTYQKHHFLLLPSHPHPPAPGLGFSSPPQPKHMLKSVSCILSLPLSCPHGTLLLSPHPHIASQHLRVYSSLLPSLLNLFAHFNGMVASEQMV